MVSPAPNFGGTGTFFGLGGAEKSDGMKRVKIANVRRGFKVLLF